MHFPPSFIDRLINSIMPSHIIGKTVRLKHASGGEHSGLCPFHKEKTPSFTVSDSKGFYHCFGCGAHGTIINFLMENEGKTFTEAVTNLAEIASIPIPKPDPKAVKEQDKASQLFEITEKACQFFQQQLSLPESKQVQNYIVGRNIQKAVQHFRLGYAPNSRHALQSFFNKQGYANSLLEEAGLLIKLDNGDYLDRFRNRLIFPIFDYKNKVIAFGGRILGDGQPKYLNSPETPIFHKGDILYMPSDARNIAYKSGNITVTEGYMDVIALYLAGIKNVAAPLGTAVTHNHIKHLWQMAKSPTICLDGDEAGKRAMERLATNTLPLLVPGYSLQFAVLPNKQDPDDIIQQHGVSVMRKILQDTKPLANIIWDITHHHASLTNPEGKAAFEQQLHNHANAIKDNQVRRYYNSFFKQRLWELNRFKSYSPAGNSTRSSAVTLAAASKANEREHIEQQLLSLLMQDPNLLQNHFIEDSLTHMEFISKALDKTRLAILEICHSKNNVDKDTLHDCLQDKQISTDLAKRIQDNSCHHAVAKGASYSEQTWLYMVDLYHLVLMREEYQHVLTKMTEDSELLATELAKQISIAEQQVADKKILLEQYEEI